MYFAGGETVTVVRAAISDRVGDTIGPPASHSIEGCGINWLSTSDDTDRRDTSITTAELYCPSGADIRSTDKVRLANGDLFHVDGRPASWRNPFTGWEAGLVVRIKAVK